MAERRRLRMESLETRSLLAADLGLTSFGPPPDGLTEYSPIDGYGNNVDNPEWGSTGEQLLRNTTIEYGDNVWTPAGADRPSAREVSNAVSAQSGPVPNNRYLTNLTWLWGQFVDHDIDLTQGADPAEPMPIPVPQGDPYFDPMNTGTQTISLNRSIYDADTGDEAGDPRQQINEITAFLDGSNVYGSDAVRAAELRTFSGGHLKTSAGDLLPFNEAGLPNAGGTSDTLFLAGDVRANENAALTSMHTLWVREHNRIADEMAARNPSLTDEQIYQQARAIVVAEIQAITYNEFLPALLGFGAIAPYSGYDSSVNPGISNIFSTAAYRFGHSMLTTDLYRLNNDGTMIADGNLALRDAFFAPQQVSDHGIDSLLRGMASQQAEEVDTLVVDDVRNFLFGPPGAGGFDLAALNIQRGRDHGLPDYNQAREDLGLERVTSFDEITSDPTLAAKLRAVYGTADGADNVDDVDLWVGGLAEDHLPGSSVGELVQTVLVDQFTRIRDGNRFWYQNVFHGRQLQEIERTTLADVIRRNTDIDGVQDNVFFMPSVMFYQADAQRPAADVTLVITDTTVTLVDQHTHHVIDSRPLAEVSQVILAGSDRGADHFTVDIRTDSTELPEIVLYGGKGKGDSLTLRGTRGDDEIVVDGRSVTINDNLLSRWGFEQLVIAPSGGHDDVNVVDDGGTRVVVLSPRGPQPDHSDPPRTAATNAPAPRGSENHSGGHNDRGRQIAELTQGPLLSQSLADAINAIARGRRG